MSSSVLDAIAAGLRYYQLNESAFYLRKLETSVLPQDADFEKTRIEKGMSTRDLIRITTRYRHVPMLIEVRPVFWGQPSVAVKQTYYESTSPEIAKMESDVRDIFEKLLVLGVTPRAFPIGMGRG